MEQYLWVIGLTASTRIKKYIFRSTVEIIVLYEGKCGNYIRTINIKSMCRIIRLNTQITKTHTQYDRKWKKYFVS